MKQIQAIYREESKLADLSAEERLAQRQLVIKPLVEVLLAYLKQNESLIPQSGKIKEAFTYAFNQERYLKVFLEDGEVPMDNNIALSTLARQSIIHFLYKEGKFTKFES